MPRWLAPPARPASLARLNAMAATIRRAEADDPGWAAELRRAAWALAYGDVLWLRDATRGEE